MGKPAICIQTDFGIHWGAPSSMHGVIASIDPAIRVDDITHMLPKFDPWAASYCLFYTMPTWPAGTVFVSVVDPGVGTARKACVAKTAGGQYVVTPDNGSLTHVKKLLGIAEVREIDESVNRRPGSEKFNTFHGRDLFAYCAGKLAAGLIGFEQVGPAYPAEDIIVYPTPEPSVAPGLVEGYITMCDTHFGGVSSNVAITQFEAAGFEHGQMVKVSIERDGKPFFHSPVLYHRSFGFVKLGEPIVYNGLTGFISMGLREADLLERYPLGAGPDWAIRFEKHC